jgi:hypothetical protein
MSDDAAARLDALARAASAHRLLSAKAKALEASARALEAAVRALPGDGAAPARLCLCAGVLTELPAASARAALAPFAAAARAAAAAADGAAGVAAARADAAPDFVLRAVSADPCR